MLVQASAHSTILNYANARTTRYRRTFRKATAISAHVNDPGPKTHERDDEIHAPTSVRIRGAICSPALGTTHFWLRESSMTAAWETHPDAEQPGVKFRLSGLAELGGDTPGLGELKEMCKREADDGIDPSMGGTVEVGLLLPEDDYESLKAYAKTLPVQRKFMRRRK